MQLNNEAWISLCFRESIQGDTVANEITRHNCRIWMQYLCWAISNEDLKEEYSLKLRLSFFLPIIYSLHNIQLEWKSVSPTFKVLCWTGRIQLLRSAFLCSWQLRWQPTKKPDILRLQPWWLGTGLYWANPTCPPTCMARMMTTVLPTVWTSLYFGF